MTSSLPADSSDQPSPRTVRDALDFVRLGGAEAVSFFQAADERSAATALLRFSAVPAHRQGDEELARRGRECATALPAQGVRGFGASVQAAKWLMLIFQVCTLAAAGWALLSFIAGDPNRDPYILPREIVFLPFEEILLLAPIMLLPFYAAAHLAAVWRARTTTRAQLRWASEDATARRLGLPAQSPYAKIMASWEGLKICAGGVLLMDGFMTVFLYFARLRDEPYGLFLAPVVCALPILAVYLISGARTRTAARRHVLLSALLYRVPEDDEISLPSSTVVEEMGLAAMPFEDRAEQSAGGVTEWRSGFDDGAPPADELVDPGRRER